MTPLLAILVVLLICGFLLWAINLIPFIDGWMKQLIQGAIALFIVIWLLMKLLPMAGVAF